jgi:ribosomal protein S18 acetylase RimI-like enzyme
MTDPFDIRRAVASDAAGLAAFATRLFRATYSDDTAAADLDLYIAKAFTPDMQAAEIADPSGAVFVATTGGTLAGYAQLVVPASQPGTAVLSRIYIDADWRGKGLAKNLLDTVVAECAARGVQHLQLTVYEKNARAIAFYTKVGFVVTGSTTFTVGDDVQKDVVMELDLSVGQRP